MVWHNAKDALTRLAITAHPTSFKKAHDGSIFIPNLISAFNVKDKYSFCHSYSQSILLSPNCALKLSIIKVCRNVWPIWLWLIPHQFLLVDSKHQRLLKKFPYSLTSYFSALDFWHTPVWNFEFDELNFFPSLNWIFASYTGIKSPV